VGIVVSGFTFKGHPTPVSVADLVDENGVLESRLITNIDNDIKFKNGYTQPQTGNIHLIQQVESLRLTLIMWLTGMFSDMATDN
jgi:hypothetical protein